jgi:catechol 2,3-dioxygenase-like lactoylglutathione lyase family enzyme
MTDNLFEMKLEVVALPVAEVDRAKTFYTEKLGFNLDFDTPVSDTVRIVQLTPPGSACSIQIGTGLGEISEMKPGTVKGVLLVVKDIQKVRQTLIERGVAVSAVNEYPRGIKDASFHDPDGNLWLLQEIPPNL